MTSATYASRKTVRSLYVHVPFCHSRCAYCDFFSVVPRERETILRWRDGVLTELRRIADEASANGVAVGPLETLYFGGGTPTVAPTSVISEIIRECKTLFSLAPNCEITLEANPESFLRPEGRAEALRDAGVTRVSLGAQSASDRTLALAGRLHTVEDIEKAVRSARDAGFDAISCDFITGLPDETLADTEDVLNLVRALPLNHVSVYALSVSRGTRFASLFQKDPGRFPDDDLERRMTRRLIEGLRALGFIHYEISNFALPGAESRHNTVYWRADPYLAAGPSASSYMGGIRRTNPPSIEKWLALLGDRHAGPFGEATVDEIVDEDAARVETVILGLRLKAGVDRAVFQRRHGVSIDALFPGVIQSLTAKGLIEDDGKTIHLTALGLDFADVAARAFL